MASLSWLTGRYSGKGPHVEGPAPLLRERLMPLGRIVGDWEYDSEWHLAGGSVSHQQGEMHSAWILNGTGIQEIWTVQSESPSPGPATKTWGMDIFCYDPQIDAWWNIWIRPLRQLSGPNIGQEAGDEFIFSGSTPDGSAHYRWTIAEITSTSFRCRKVSSYDGGTTWALEGDISLRRSGSSPLRE
jgi:hypothetical protein